MTRVNIDTRFGRRWRTISRGTMIHTASETVHDSALGCYSLWCCAAHAAADARRTRVAAYTPRPHGSDSYLRGDVAAHDAWAADVVAVPRADTVDRDARTVAR